MSEGSKIWWVWGKGKRLRGEGEGSKKKWVRGKGSKINWARGKKARDRSEGSKKERGLGGKERGDPGVREQEGEKEAKAK